MSPWSLSIKTVGGQEATGNESFTVKVSPDDALTSLNEQIEGVTGLEASQQRLIYRGRLIGGKGTDDEESEESSPRIRDVAGLCDGHTIHLVPKPASEAPAAADVGESSTRPSSEENEGTSSSGTGTASLLAALLGLGSSADDEDDAEEPSTQRRGQRQRLLTTRSRSRRSANYRLTSDDIVPPDPGSLEPVRQGLLTLHTMLPPSSSNAEAAEVAAEDESNQVEESSPMDTNRQWYRGQWIDCLDTVNQWLEATVVDILDAEDVLPPSRIGNRARSRGSRQPRAATRAADPAVSANDFEGRRRLLLEACDEDDIDEEEGELAGFREREDNEGVQLLLVHYNGWPQRWDEWLRGDSPRIRPFRTRTRHPSSAPYVSPTPQSVFHAAPSTYFKDEDDETDRKSLLPELSRAVAAVNDILSAATASPVDTTETASSTSDLPWLGNDAGGEDETSSPSAGGDRDASESPHPWDENSGSRRRIDHVQLESLAPLLDRLGRTLTDAAPHVASLASSLRQEDESSLPTATAVSEENSDEVANNESSTRGSTGSGFFSLLSRDSRRRASANTDASTPLLSSQGTSEQGVETQTAVRTEPDHVDFVNGMVNTHRGESRGGSRRGSSDDGAGLLGAYLAAASLSSLASGGGDGDENREDTGGTGALGRMLRQGGAGGGGGGIDIHIHAIVTGPGVGPGPVGLTMMGGGTGTPTVEPNTSNSGSRDTDLAAVQSPTPPVSDHDDLGLFSDLYTENPQPTDHHGSEETDEVVGTDGDTAAENPGDTVPPETEATPTADSGASRVSEVRTHSLGSDRSGGRSSSSSSRNSFSPRRGSSFRRILGRAMGRRSSRSDTNRSSFRNS